VNGIMNRKDSKPSSTLRKGDNKTNKKKWDGEGPRGDLRGGIMTRAEGETGQKKGYL